MQQMMKWLRGRPRMMVSVLAILSAIGLALYAPFRQAGPPIAAADLFAGSTLAAGLRGVLGVWAVVILSRFTLPHLTARRLRYALRTALFLSLSCVIGAELQVYGTLRLDLPSIALCALCWLGLCAFFLFCLLMPLTYGGKALRWLNGNPLEARLQSVSLFSIPGEVKPLPSVAGTPTAFRAFPLFFLAQAILLLCWLPVWLAYYPGLANYDIISHMQQCIAHEYSTLHPLLYTLLLQACLWLSNLLGGETTLAIALLCILQMLLMSAVMAYAVMQLRRYGASVLACAIALLFFGLFPVFPLLAISTTKDVPYAAFTLLVMVQILSLLQQPEAFLSSCKSCLVFVITGTVMGLLRYNGIVSLSLFALILLFVRQLPRNKRDSRLKGWRIKLRMAALLAITALLTWLGTLGFNTVTDASPSFVTLRDMASLPSQQLVRAALEMEPDSDEYHEVLRWYSGHSMLLNYRPRLADYTKRYINVDHDNGWRGFAETWLMVAQTHPKAYAEAFWELNRGLWFVQDLSHANIYPEELSGFGYLLNNQVDCAEHIDDCAPTVFVSLLPGLKTFYNALTTENHYLKIPVLRTLFSVGFQCWLSVLLFLAACYRRDRALAYAMGWILCLLVVLAFAPAVLVRYTLPVFLGNGFGGLALMRKKKMPAQG